MKTSYHQPLFGVSPGRSPTVSREAFKYALTIKGQVATLYHRPTAYDCPCVDEVYKQADPNCSVCGGTGSVSGFSSAPVASFIAAFFFDAEMRQDQHQELVTKVGSMQTMDGRMYCEGRWWNVIHVGDSVVVKTRGASIGVELRIISKMPRTANEGEIIFIRCDLEKQPMRDRRDATDVGEII